MNFLSYTIVLNEVPNEVSLAFNMTGCPNRCKGCHTPELRDPNLGTPLTEEVLHETLNKYDSFITCVCFFGGEWNPVEICRLLDIIKLEYNLKTCLYSGCYNVATEIYDRLDFVKLGPYQEENGPLNVKTTNQKFIETKTGNLLNCLFWR